MLNLESFGFLEVLNNLNLPIWLVSFIFSYSLTLILSLEKATRKGIPTKDIFNLVSIVAISSIIGARMMHLAIIQTDINWVNVLSWGEIFYDGKLNIMGGYLGGFIAACFYLQGFDAIKRSGMSWLRFFDTFLPVLSIGMTFGYIGMFFVNINNGIITSTQYPWLVMMGDSYVHPWALYVAVGYLLLLSIQSIVYNMSYRFRKSGYMTVLFVLGVSSIHFITDFWKNTDTQEGMSIISGLTITQVFSLGIFLITLIGLIMIKIKDSRI